MRVRPSEPWSQTVTSPPAVRALLVSFALVILGVAGGQVLRPEGPALVPWVLLLVAGIGLGLILLFTRLHLSIVGEHLSLRLGVWTRKVALVDIQAARPIRYVWWKFGGWGIRKQKNGWMYSVPGDGGLAVELDLGGERLWFSADDPSEVCGALRLRIPGLGERMD